MVFSVASADRVLLPVTLWKVGAHSASVEYGFCMRTAPALLISALVALTLVACVPDDEPVRPEPSPSSSPIFESDEEALAAAEEAYGAYLEVSNVVTSSGAHDASPLASLTTADMFETLSESLRNYSDNQLHSGGISTFDTSTLQQYVDNGDGTGTVIVYTCLDVSALRILDVAGNDITPADRDDRLPLELTFMADARNNPTLLLEGSALWDGTDFCG